MIIGQYVSKLTDKDRVSVPKKFRDELGNDLIVARWYENCLVLVTKENWKLIQSRLIGTTKTVIEPVRDIDRFILGSAYEIELDAQGRFVVPELLINHAELTEDVVFVGLLDRVEVWSKQLWESLEEQSQQKATRAVEMIAREKL